MPILHPEVEAAPLGDLRALEERQLRDGLLVHASRSALYRARWREAGIDPGAIHTLQDLQRLPYIRGVALREVWQPPPRQDAFRIAIFGTPAPFVSDAAAYALLAAHVAARLPVEYILSSPTQAAVTLAFLADHRPTAVIGFPSLLPRTAAGIAPGAPQAARTGRRGGPPLGPLARRGA